MAKEFSLFLKIQNLASDDIHKRKYRITEGRELYLGRSSEFANVVLLDEGVSRQHAVIKVLKGELVIEDLESGNGTYIEGSKISTTGLKEKQLIVIGGFEITVNKIATGEVDDSSIEFHEEEEIKKIQKAASGGSPIQGSSKQGRKDKVDEWTNAKSVKGFIDLVKTKLMQLKDQQLQFFDNQNYDGDVKNSLIVASVAIMSPVFVSVLLSDSSALYLVAVMVATGISQVINLYLMAYVFNRMRKWIGMDGSLESYLRYFATLIILMFPFNFIASLPVPVVGLVALINIPIGLVGLYKFYKIFKPVLIRFVVGIIVAGVLSFGANTILMIGVTTVIPAPTVEVQDNNVFRKMKHGQKKALDQAMQED